MRLPLHTAGLIALLSASAGLCAAADDQFASAQTFLNSYCKACHSGKSAVGGFRLEQVTDPESLRDRAEKWGRALLRVRNGEMPPKGSPAPDLDAREQFTHWADQALRTAACAAGVTPGPSMIRRLNRDEYSATLNDLLDLHMDFGRLLPGEGAGGEGFDNAAETLFLSPLHSEKYMEAATLAMDFARKEYKSRNKILVAAPGAGVTEEEAARRVIAKFLPQAFRRPVQPSDVAAYLSLYRAARKQGESWEGAVFFSLRTVLTSPMFLFRFEPPNASGDLRPLDQYSLASRLSYFLWGSMPDELLLDVAAAGRLQDEEVLKQLIPRMLRHDRALNFAQRFTEQWLRTRELGIDKQPDPELFPEYARDEELRSDIRSEPFLFFRELLVRDLPLVNLIDSTHTIGTSNLEKHYGIELPLDKGRRKQPQWVELPRDGRRGGLLGMAAILTVSSYPYRTSPVLRGTWVMDSILGTPPPPPPPDVPALEEPPAGAPAATVRERLAQHRANAACASCHDRIDPLGFALENYDAVGRWRTEDAGKPIDNRGQLADGTPIDGADGLKAVLMERKDLFIRNLTAKMLGYALGRGLTLQDSCTVDRIADEVKTKDYRAQALVEAIVLSVPFRYQGPAPPEKDAPATGATARDGKPGAGKELTE